MTKKDYIKISNLERYKMKTLKDFLISTDQDGLPHNDIITKNLDSRIVKEFSTSGYVQDFPFTQKNISWWVVIEDGTAFALNESSRGRYIVVGKKKVILQGAA